MRTKVEGILLKKAPFKERDLICRLLLRNGQMVSTLFYGGQGGGAKRRPSHLQFGHLIGMELNQSRKGNSDLFASRDYKLSWQHELIRDDHRAFYLLCFFLETLEKISTPFDPHEEFDDEDIEQEGLFRVLSNAIFYLDDSLKRNQFSKWDQGTLFLSKLLSILGLFPQAELCTYCDKVLRVELEPRLLPEHGAFSCNECHQEAGGHHNLWQSLKVIQQMPYKNYGSLKGLEKPDFEELYRYFCYQNQIEPYYIKAYAML